MSHSILFEDCSYTIEQHGNGEVPLLLLHGFCFDQSVWSKIIPELSDFRVLTFDHSGMGQSKLHSDHSISKMAELVKSVLDNLQIERCFLVGHSMGGYIAASFASSFPERLLGLTMMNSHPYVDSHGKKENRQKTIEFLEKYGAEKFVQQLIPTLFTSDYASQHPQVLLECTSKAATFQTASIIASQRAMIDRADVTAGLRNQIFPIQFIIGKHDEAIAAELSIAQTLLPEAACVTYLKSVAHMAMLEAPQETAASIAAFVQFAKITHA